MQDFVTYLNRRQMEEQISGIIDWMSSLTKGCVIGVSEVPEHEF